MNERVDPPYGIAAIVDITSFEDYAKDQATPAYQQDFMPKFMKWVKGLMILRCGEIYHGE